MLSRLTGSEERVSELPNVPPMVEVDRPEEHPGILIDGVRYELPRVDDLDLDEEQILFDVSGVILPDFMPAHPSAPEEVKTAVALIQSARIRNPAFKRALVIIAYRRGNPGLSVEEIEQRVGKIDAMDAELALYGKARDAEAEDAERP